MMKKCAICRQEKEASLEKDSEFAKDASRVDGFQNKCKLCQKGLSARHFQENKTDYYLNNNARRKQLREEIAQLKESTSCTDCKKFYPHYVLDYDHLNDKIVSVSKLIARRGSRVAVMAEIAKCELVCSNCHRIRTHNRLQLNNQSSIG